MAKLGLLASVARQGRRMSAAIVQQGRRLSTAAVVVGQDIHRRVSVGAAAALEPYPKFMSFLGLQAALKTEVETLIPATIVQVRRLHFLSIFC